MVAAPALISAQSWTIPMQLYRKYAPQSWSEVIDHKHVKSAVSLMKSRGALGGKAFLVTVPSGIGKSTCARLIAQDVCDEDNIIDLDASGLTPAGVVELERSLRTLAIGDKPGRAVTINECHALRKDTIRQLLVTLERIPAHCCWLLTTTNLGQQVLFDGIDASPLLSRCIEFRLEANRYLERFAERAMAIDETEGLGGAAFSEYVDVAKRTDCNFRRMLSCLEAGELFRESALAVCA